MCILKKARRKVVGSARLLSTTPVSVGDENSLVAFILHVLIRDVYICFSQIDEKDSYSEDDDDDNEDGGYYIMFRRPEELMPSSCVFDRLERGEADR